MPVMIMMMVSGIRKKAWPMTSIDVPQPLRQQIVHDVDADVLIGEQCPWRAQ